MLYAELIKLNLYIKQPRRPAKNPSAEDLAFSFSSSTLRSDTISSRFFTLFSSCWTRDPSDYAFFFSKETSSSFDFNQSSFTSASSLNLLQAFFRIFMYSVFSTWFFGLNSSAISGFTANIFLTNVTCQGKRVFVTQKRNLNPYIVKDAIV